MCTTPSSDPKVVPVPGGKHLRAHGLKPVLVRLLGLVVARVALEARHGQPTGRPKPTKRPNAREGGRLSSPKGSTARKKVRRVCEKVMVVSTTAGGRGRRRAAGAGGRGRRARLDGRAANAANAAGSSGAMAPQPPAAVAQWRRIHTYIHCINTWMNRWIPYRAMKLYK